MGWLHSTVRLDIPVDPAFDRTGRTSHSPEGEPKTSFAPIVPRGRERFSRGAVGRVLLRPEASEPAFGKIRTLLHP